MHKIETEKFIDNTISLKKMVDLKRENITILNLMALMIKARTEKYPTRDLLGQAMSLAYGLISVFGISGYGSQVLMDYRFRYIRPELIEDEKYLDEVLDLMKQILFHPVFTEEGLQEAKNLLENKLISMEAEPDTQALVNALAISQPSGSSMTVAMQGYRQDLDQITLQDIQKAWDEFKELPFEIMTCGEIDPRIMEFLESLKQTSWKFKNKQLAQSQEPVNKEIHMGVSSCALVQIYRTGIGPKDPLSFALLCANSILGASPMSMLFEEIREKHSLCYRINSSLIRFDGAMVISTATQQENLPEVKKLIAVELQKLQKGEFSDELMQSAKLDLIDGILTQQDHPASLLAQSFLNSFLERYISPEQMIEVIEGISKKEIMEAVRGLEMLCSVSIVNGGEQE